MFVSEGQCAHEPQPRIDGLLLSGPSCSGKSSIARELQTALPVPALRIKADSVFPAPPDGHMGWHKAEMHQTVVLAFHRSIATWAEAGFHLIVDGSLPYERALRDEYIDIFHPYDVRLIGVSCDVAELNKRETASQSLQPLGWSAQQAKDIHDGMHYAATVDITRHTPAECAAEIAHQLAATE